MRCRAYNSYWNMRRRCYNARHPKYARYGGRGITVCARWRESFDNSHAIDAAPNITSLVANE